MRIDLHAHSSVSDGTDSPTELVEAAVEAGLDVVAITDHDTVAGWDEAGAAAQAAGIRLVRGIEISTKHHGVTVHLLAYEPSPHHAPLVEALDRARSSREERLDHVLARLDALGLPVERSDVLRIAGGAAAGKPHVARALVEAGHLRSTAEAYDDLLEEGGRAYVERYTLALADAVQLVTDAVGTAVVAHPWGRKSRDVLDESGLRSLLAHGLAGIEVHHPDHDRDTAAELGEIADRLGLLATGSSDYHGSAKDLTRFHLGARTTPPQDFEKLLGWWPGARDSSFEPPPDLAKTET